MPGLLDFLSHFYDYRLVFAIVLAIILYDSWSRFAKREKWLRFVVSILPKYANAHYNLAAFLLKYPRRFDEAERELRLAIELDPKLPDAYRSLVALLDHKKADVQEIDAIYSQMQLMIPDDTAPYMWRATNFLRKRMFAESEQSVRQAINVAPRFGPAYELLAGLLRLQKRFPEALEAYEKAVNFGVGNAKLHAELAQIAEQLERYPVAEKAYRRVIALEPKNIDAYSELTRLLEKQKRYQDAEKLLKKGIEINPQAAILKALLAYSINHLGNQPKALELLSEIASLESNDAHTFYLIAYWYHGQKFHKEAEIAYRNAIRKDSKVINAYYWLGGLLVQNERYQEAEALYQQAILIDDKNAQLFWALGMLYHSRLKRYQDADAAFQKVTELTPAVADAFYNIACANSLLQNKERALKYLKIGLEKGSSAAHAWIDSDLEWIRKDPAFAEIVGPKPE